LPKRTLHIAGEASAEMNLEATGGQTDWKTWNLLVDGASGGKQNLTFRILNDEGTSESLKAFVLWNTGNATLYGSLATGNNGLTVGTNQLVVSNDNVGIGTSTPTARLDVAGNANISGTLNVGGLAANIVNTTTIVDASITGPKIANGAVTDAKITGPISAAKLTGVLTLPANGLAIGVNQLVASGGNIGIGTTTPGFTLDVNGTGRVTSNFDLTAAGSQVGFNRNSTNGTIYNSSNNAWQMGPNGTNDPFVISAWGTNGALLSKPLVLTTDGKAGIGTSTPKRPLHIAGAASAEMNLEATGGMTDWKNWNLLVDGGSGARQNLTFRILNDAGTAPMRNALVLWNDGNATLAGTLTQTSDLRLKTDIQPLDDTLAKVLRLRGVSYVMKADETKERKIGVIAQELEHEYPELVATDDKGMKSVAYANLAAVLIEAVKGLKAENTAQKSEIENLKTRLDRLEQLLSGK
jgi:hypothetical protein